MVKQIVPKETDQAEALKRKIAFAWFAKIELRYDEAVSLLTEVKMILGIPAGHLTESEVNRTVAVWGEVALEVLSLSSEIFRCIGDDSHSSELMEWVEAASKHEAMRPGFWRCYAKAMGSFTSGDYTLALEEYLRAQQAVTNSTEKLIADGNLVLTLENLGLPYQSTLKEAKKAIETADADVVSRAQSQFKALELRELFREGKFRELVKLRKALLSKPVDQSYYFSLWVTQLPYHDKYRALADAELTQFTTSPCHQHHKSYRQRTLQGMVHPDEKKLTKPSEFVERLYLWVWRWLEQPESHSVEKIILLLREFVPAHFNHRLTVEDHQFFANSMLWLSLFDPSSEIQVNRILGKMVPSTRSHYPLLKFENLVVHYLIALRDGSDLAQEYMKALQQDPLWDSDEIQFRALVEFATGATKHPPKNLEGLANSLSDLFRRTHAGRISVNLKTGEIFLKGQSETLISTAMAAAFHLLFTQSRVSCEQFAAICFKLSRYDEIAHYAKIQNLLSRMKSIVGTTLRFGIKDGHVFAEGDWTGVKFKKGLPLTGFDNDLGQLSQRIFGPEVPVSQPGIAFAENASRRVEACWSALPWNEGVSRVELEKWLGRPRSTVNRLLKQWIDDGKITRTGNARSSQYRLAVKEERA